MDEDEARLRVEPLRLLPEPLPLPLPLLREPLPLPLLREPLPLPLPPLDGEPQRRRDRSATIHRCCGWMTPRCCG